MTELGFEPRTGLTLMPGAAAPSLYHLHMLHHLYTSLTGGITRLHVVERL